jgi:hypothetical protein
MAFVTFDWRKRRFLFALPRFEGFFSVYRFSHGKNRSDSFRVQNMKNEGNRQSENSDIKLIIKTSLSRIIIQLSWPLGNLLPLQNFKSSTKFSTRSRIAWSFAAWESSLTVYLFIIHRDFRLHAWCWGKVALTQICRAHMALSIFRSHQHLRQIIVFPPFDEVHLHSLRANCVSLSNYHLGGFLCQRRSFPFFARYANEKGREKGRQSFKRRHKLAMLNLISVLLCKTYNLYVWNAKENFLFPIPANEFIQIHKHFRFCRVQKKDEETKGGRMNEMIFSIFLM